MTGLALLSDPRLILEEQIILEEQTGTFVFCTYSEGFSEVAGLFLKTACAAKSFSGWLGRAVCRGSLSLRRIFALHPRSITIRGVGPMLERRYPM